MKITRSSKTTLKFITAKKQVMLNGIMDEYSRVANMFIENFWQQSYECKDLTKGVTSIPVSWLSSRIRQCAAREALGMVNSAKESALAKGIIPIKPIHTGQKMVLSSQCIKIVDDVNTFDLWITLYSVGQGIKINIPLKKHRHMNMFAEWKRSSTVIIHREYVQFSFELEVELKAIEGSLLGLDIGINYLITTSKGQFIGSDVKDLINTIKRKQQGSKAYTRAKKTLSYYLHKQVKDFFLANPALRLVVVERLKGLKQGKQSQRSKAFRKTLSNWNYRELLDIIEMRTQENSVSFRFVNPYKTSQQCPNCSHTERGNRYGEKFCCLRCGYSDHADFVGAQNILNRFISGRYGAAFKT